MLQKIAIFAFSFFLFQGLHGQSTMQQFFTNTEAFLSKNVVGDGLNYEKLATSNELSALIKTIENADISNLDAATKKAFYINAYNLHVINQVLKAYPIESVQDIPGFFDRKKVKIAGKSQSLNKFEKSLVLKEFPDPRLHFVLVCGALDCPPIINEAYRPETLDAQLDNQTKIALNNPNFLKKEGNKYSLSQIFKWYVKDFGGSKAKVLDFINQYKEQSLPADASISYYPYDWSLNDVMLDQSGNQIRTTRANASRYIVSSTISKGSFEFKIFNNLYSQKTGSPDDLTDRSTFYTVSLSALYGLTDNFNIGLNTRYRRVRNDRLPSSPFSAVFSGGGDSFRSGITAIGPQIRYAPVPKWQNFSIQSSFVFAVGDNLTGTATEPFIDWDGPTWNTQFFNDFSIGNYFSLFTELDFLIEDIGSSEDGHINRFSTPVTSIFSYTPNTKMTFYVLGSYSPYWQENFDYFRQFGTGFKYQYTPNLEFELLYTDFSNQFLNNTGGQAATYNLGIRVNI